MSNKVALAVLAVGALLCVPVLANAAQDAVLPNGPAPFHAADPQAPVGRSEPMQKEAATAPPRLSDGKAINGPAAGPEPYHAADPVYAK